MNTTTTTPSIDEQLVDKSAKDRVDNMVSRICFDEPFFAVILMSQVRRLDRTCSTAWVDGTTLGYNPDFIESLDRDELKGLLLHEVGHLMHLHHLRRGGRDPKGWNIAGDYVINKELKDSGYKLPKGGLISDAYDGMATEDVYATLPKEPDGGGYSDSGRELGDVRDQKTPSGTPMSDSENQEAQKDMQVKINQAYEAAKRAGNVPAGVERLVKELNDPKLPWREVLARWIGEKSKNDYSWSVPNRRYLPQDIVMPGPDGFTFGKVALACDTSASIDQDMLRDIASEALGCLSMYAEEGLEVTLPCLWCDTEVTYQELADGDVPKPEGGGGTHFTPVFEYIEEHDIKPKALIYITDGYCDDFPSVEPDYDVLWGIVGGNDGFNPPFNWEVMHVRE